MKKEKSSAMGTPYTFEGRIPLKQAIPLGLQHVMAMFVGNLTPLLIIMGACGPVSYTHLTLPTKLEV